MTITTLRKSQSIAHAVAPIRWKVVQPGLWVGKREGEFAGMIESTPDNSFEAMTHLGEHLGTFATVAAAKRRFTA